MFFFFSSRRRHTRYWHDWSSDVCSSDLPADGERDEDALGGAPDDVVGGLAVAGAGGDVEEGQLVGALGVVDAGQIGRASCRERVEISVVAVSLKKKNTLDRTCPP